MWAQAAQSFCEADSDTLDSSSVGSSSAEDNDEEAPEPHCHCGAICFVFLTIFLTTALLNVGIVLLTSSVTNAGVWFYEGLAEERTERVACYLRQFSFSGGFFCLLLVYLFDLWHWNKGCLRVVFKALVVLAALIFALGILFLTPKYPEIPLAYGIVLIMLAAYFLKVHVMKPMGIKSVAYYEGQALAYFVIFICLSVLWALFVTNSSAWNTQASERLNEDGPLLEKKAAWILWCSPAALALAHLIMGTFVWMRGRFRGHLPLDASGADVGSQVKACIIVLLFLGFGGYTAASLGGDSSLAQLVLSFNMITFLLTFLYLAKWVGLKNIEMMAEENAAVQAAAGIVASDWLKALVILMGPPVLLLIIVVEWVHEACRRCLHRCGVLDPTEDSYSRHYGCLTEGADLVLREGRLFLFSNPTSVLTKAIYLAIAIVPSVVCVSTGIPMALWWINHQLASVSLAVCLLVVLFVVVCLFLFPPISGQIIYGFAATVIVPQFGYGDRFWTGVAVSSALCLVGKLLAAGIEMKGIGLPGANSVAVKRFIGVHTKYMKALRYVLMKPGCSPGKIAILTFGPDFPTSVLTGILDMPLVPMLVGTLPVVCVIAPCCISFAYLLRAEESDDEVHASQHRSIAGINLLLSGVLGAGGVALIGYYVEAALHENQQELDRPGSDWMADPLEPQILASIKAQELAAEEWSRRTRWSGLPRGVQLCLVLGFLLATTAVYALLQPASRAFKKFGLTDDVWQLTGGSALGAINPMGWVVLWLTAALILLVSGFQAWASMLR